MFQSQVRAATPADDAFVVEMARYACVIEDRPLPDPNSSDVRDLLPGSGDVVLVATTVTGERLGAVWTFRHDPPLAGDLAEIVIAVAPLARGVGIGGALMDALVEHCADGYDALCLNVHERNPASHLYERKGFRAVGRGRGALGVAMRRRLP